MEQKEFSMKNFLNIYYSSGGYIKFQYRGHLMQATFTTKGLEIANEQTGREFFVKEEFYALILHAAEQLIANEIADKEQVQRLRKEIDKEKGP
jgi:hypothetical protein